MAEEESISKEDMDLLFITDSVEEMRDHLMVHSIEKFKLIKKNIRSHWWLGEKKS